jgi:hypothetical protein
MSYTYTVASYQAAVALSRQIVDTEREAADAVSAELVDATYATRYADSHALYARVSTWLGRSLGARPMRDTVDAMVREDPRCARYAVALADAREFARHSDADIGRGAHLAYLVVLRLARRNAAWQPVADAWPDHLRERGPVGERDPGAGTGHRER